MSIPGCENDKRLISEDEGDIVSRSEHSRFELGAISSNREDVSVIEFVLMKTIIIDIGSGLMIKHLIKFD